MAEETFRKDQVIEAIENFLQYGEDTYGKCQQGYFSRDGWAARCLRWHLKQLRNLEECSWLA